MTWIIYLAMILLFLVSLYGLVTQRNLIKLIMCFNIMESTFLIFLLTIGYKSEGTYPIIQPGVEQVYVNPLPQALALTAIVIGASTTALMLSFAFKLYQRYNTLDIEQIRRLKG